MDAIRRTFDLARVALGVTCLAAATWAQETTRHSIDSSGTEANSYSFDASLSSDGLLVAYESFANNLVSGDGNAHYDVFLHDRTTLVTEMISVDSSGVQGNRDSFLPQLSPDGRYVVFSSQSSNLVPNDTNGHFDVFIRDRVNGTTERVSIRSNGNQGNDDSYGLGVSSDGNIVYFESNATNMVANDTNASGDVFIHNRATGKTTRMSLDSSGVEGDSYSWFGGMSTDASFVTFYSASTNLVANDFNGKPDVFLHDLNAGTTIRISTDPTGLDGNGNSMLPRISSDGRFVVYRSDASNLVANDLNGFEDVFVYDRATGFSDRVSVDTNGVEGNANSLHSGTGVNAVDTYGAISTDGQIVVFDSDASNLVANDTNSVTDIFVHNRTTGVTQRVSVDSSGTPGNDISLQANVSQDGLYVGFQSIATNLVASDTNKVCDVFGHQRCPIQASWYNYGNGFPGTNGVPSLTAQSNPSFGAPFTLDIGNSSGNPSAGLLFIGFVQTSIHSGFGGDLLVIPFLTVSIPLPAGGLQLSGTIPDQESLCGFTLDMQTWQGDPGAFKGVSFSPGLALQLGY